MRKLNAAFALSFLVASAGVASAIPPPVVNLPEGTPQEIEGYTGQSLYITYRLEVDSEIEADVLDALQNIRNKDYGSEPNLRPHGAIFRHKALSESEAGQETHGRVHYNRRIDDGCDWVMEVVTVPDVDTEEWAQEHFNAVTAVSNLKTQNITSDTPWPYSGYWIGLPSPKTYISENANAQLYFGENCPGFVKVLAAESYGRKRAKKLLNLSEPPGKLSGREHVKGAVFEISIVETADERLQYYVKPSIIELKFSGASGDAIGNALFEIIRGCPNKAGANL